MVFLNNEFPDLTGKVVAGRYFLEELVGTGGFGVVHRAIDGDCREYAVKCLRRVANPNSRDAIRQIREMALHRMVSSHPNIVTIHEVVEDDQFVYVVMDFCPGGDLFEAIIEQDVFYCRDDLIKSVFVQIVDAVHSCHERGIAHRDLKPENILCNEDYSRVYLADFGLSSRDFYSEEFCCGSSFYMSPGAYLPF
jgi:serine/threonine protein kinase